jgi:hypothetical protein
MPRTGDRQLEVAAFETASDGSTRLIGVSTHPDAIVAVLRTLPTRKAARRTSVRRPSSQESSK